MTTKIRKCPTSLNKNFLSKENTNNYLIQKVKLSEYVLKINLIKLVFLLF